MARIRLSSLVSDFRGKVGGAVLQWSKFGLICKNNGWRTNSAQVAITSWKNKSQRVFHSWSLTTPEQKTDWNQLALLVPFVTDIGTLYTVPGYYLFNYINLPRVYNGLGVMFNAPAAPTWPVYYLVNDYMRYDSPSDWEAQTETYFDHENFGIATRILVWANLPAGSTMPIGGFTFDASGSYANNTHDWQDYFADNGVVWAPNTVFIVSFQIKDFDNRFWSAPFYAVFSNV